MKGFGLTLLILLQTMLGVMFGQEKFVFKKGKVGVSIGQSCPKTVCGAGTLCVATLWSKDYETGHLWVCSPVDPNYCKVAPRLANFYERDMSKPQSIALLLINGAKKEVTLTHGGSYMCYENKHSFITGGTTKITNYEVTVYDKLVCSVNVTSFKAGEVIELSCSVVATGNGVPDLLFLILDSDKKVGSVLGLDSLQGMTMKKTVRLTKSWNGRRLVCAFRGFDGRVAEERLDNCDIGQGILNVT